MICKNCGKEITDGSRFCEYCGSETLNAEESLYEFCENCGSRIPVNSRFCEHCGSRISSFVEYNVSFYINDQENKSKDANSESPNDVIENIELDNTLKNQGIEETIISSDGLEDVATSEECDDTQFADVQEKDEEDSVLIGECTEKLQGSTQEKTKRKKVWIPIVVIVVLIITGIIIFLNLDDTLPTFKDEFEIEQPSYPVVLKSHDRDLTVNEGENYTCWNDISVFDVTQENINLSGIEVFSSNENVCEAYIENGMLVCKSKAEGESVITIKTEQSEAKFNWIVNQKYVKDEEKGITIQLDDGTVIHPGENANSLANCAGAWVKYNGIVVDGYKCDVNGHGTDGAAVSPWFRCETDWNGKLYLWTLDKGVYKLSIKYDGVVYRFPVQVDGYRLCASIEGNTYFCGFGGLTQSQKISVYLDNKLCDDFSFNISDESFGEIKRIDNRYLDCSNANTFVAGDTILTIKAGGLERSYVWYCKTESRGGAEYVLNVAPEFEISQDNISKSGETQNVLSSEPANNGLKSDNQTVVKDDSGKCGENLSYTFDSKTATLTINNTNMNENI